GHGRERGEVTELEPSGIDAAQPMGVKGRLRRGVGQQLPQCPGLMRAELLLTPVEALKMGRQSPRQLRSDHLRDIEFVPPVASSWSSLRYRAGNLRYYAQVPCTRQPDHGSCTMSSRRPPGIIAVFRRTAKVMVSELIERLQELGYHDVAPAFH